MALSYKARRRLSLLVLLVWMPFAIVVVVSVMAMFGRPPFLVELLIYVVAGAGIFYPFKFVFQGVGKADPDASPEE